VRFFGQRSKLREYYRKNKVFKNGGMKNENIIIC
jgi:hypothetical protein